MVTRVTPATTFGKTGNHHQDYYRRKGTQPLIVMATQNDSKRPFRVAILSSSVRIGRLSHRVALYIQRYLETQLSLTAEIVDLKEYDFPLFDERLAYQQSPSEKLLDFTRRLMGADGIVIVSPVYNASFPAALKNVIDLYYAEWKRKPVGIVSVTSGSVPGIATVQQLQTLMLKLGALVVPTLCTVVKVAETFSETGEGSPVAERIIRPLLEDLQWLLNQTVSRID